MISRQVFVKIELLHVDKLDSLDEFYFAGVDIGSVTAKTIILHKGLVVARSLVPTEISSEESGLKALKKALENAGLSRSDLKYIIATGYGRISASYANKTVTEITCHARGANFINSATRTVVDMGGQDCKVMRLDNEGHVIDFVLNDKCAAGTGRFLEVISRIFAMALDQLGPASLKANERTVVSSTCTVFAESEVISLMARGERPENVIAGVHYAVANRIAGLFTRTGVEDEVFFSGGGAKNSGMVRALEEILDKKIVTPIPSEDPQLIGALGAALLAQEICTGKFLKA